MLSPLAAFGAAWQDFVDGLADMQTDLLRRMAADMASAVDDEARKCLDGDRFNTAPSNWEAIPRALLPRLAGGARKTKVAYDDAPAEMKPVIMAVAKLEHAARTKRRSPE